MVKKEHQQSGYKSRRCFLKSTATSIAAITLGRSAIKSSAQTSHQQCLPNIIIILADDLGYGDLSCYGSKDLPTPNIDSIAHNGIKFTDFYVSMPVCTPSRFSLLTGLLPNRSKDKFDNALYPPWPQDNHRGIRPSETTIATILAEHGYNTAIIGKWHLGHGGPEFLPTRHGFKTFYGHTTGCIDYYEHKYGNIADWYRNEDKITEAGYATDLQSHEAVRFINRQKSTHPFFLYLAYSAPHYAKGWDPERKGYVNFLQAKPEDLAKFQHIKNTDRRTYCAMVKAMDDGIADVLAALKRKGVDNHTLLMFISDNGGSLPYGGDNGLLRSGKGTLWEGGIRVPALMKWPARIKPGTITSQPASTLDVFPTLCGLLGVSVNNMNLDGVDLLPTMVANTPISRDLFWLYSGNEAFRRGPWKYHRPKQRIPMLFNLEQDISEQTNLANQHPEKLKELITAHKAISTGF